MMRKIIITMAICLGFMYANAQHIGIKGGLNLAKMKFEAANVDWATNSLTAFQVGLVGDFEISDPIYFNTGLLFSQKGTKLNVLGVDVKIPVNFLEIPLNIAYKYDLGEAKLYGQAGPFIGIALTGKTKSGDDEEDIEFGSDDDEWKRLDAGLNFGAGVEIAAVQLGVNYGLGLANLANEEDAMIKTGVFSITAAYFFGK